jgi:hypothetical protein
MLLSSSGLQQVFTACFKCIPFGLACAPLTPHPGKNEKLAFRKRLKRLQWREPSRERHANLDQSSDCQSYTLFSELCNQVWGSR